MSTFGAVALIIIATFLTLATLVFIMWVIELEAPMKAPPVEVQETKAWVPFKLCQDCGHFASRHYGYPGRNPVAGTSCFSVVPLDSKGAYMCTCTRLAQDV